MQLKVKEESINKEVMILRAEWGYFKINIKILNVNEENRKHGRFICEGSFGSIYQGELLGKIFVMKCLPVQSALSRYKAIKEWFLMKLSAVAGIGPSVESYFGFDILMFSKFI